MRLPRLTIRQWIGYAGLALVFLLAAAVAVWRGDILQAGLDPKVPFQTYVPPPAPDYARPQAWALLDRRVPGAGEAHVFFAHSTTYDGGREWNGPIADVQSRRYLERVVLPNYAAPFAGVGDVSAPLYRQASLYTRLTLRDDARDARAFAYRDIATAFDAFLARHPNGPIVLVGVEQGGELLDRLLRERVAPDASLRARLVAAYLIDVVVAVDRVPPEIGACGDRHQSGCIIAWSDVREGADDDAARRRLKRALVWSDQGHLVALDGRAALCVNPMMGAATDEPAPRRLHKGATNATGLEWDARPALMAREVEATCRAGILRAAYPSQESFRTRGGWAERRKARQFNLFYGNLKEDVEVRLAAWRASHHG